MVYGANLTKKLVTQKNYDCFQMSKQEIIPTYNFVVTENALSQ